MKLNTILKRTPRWTLALLSLLWLSGLAVSCTENIDESNYAIATEQTVTDFLSSNEDLSEIKSIFDRVRLGDSDQASSITSVLSARGNYTVFAPTNEAIDTYVASLGVASLDELSYEQAQLIANSCVIDNGEQSAYETADFPTPGTFALSNLNDRLLTCELDTVGSESYYLINGEARVVSEDNEVSNGMVHIVSTVIAPSSDLLPEMIAAADNLKIMSYLLTQTHVCDSLLEERDAEYEETNHDETLNLASGETLSMPDHRYLGYTGFVEPDDVYEREWGHQPADGRRGQRDELGRSDGHHPGALRRDLQHRRRRHDDCRRGRRPDESGQRREPLRGLSLHQGPPRLRPSGAPL